ncbi:MAG: hypothetical protein EOP60_08965 [Sphingomonadales bacterium]|nr:MAG: hypothetical protein EOP60_08965 [Sphingomonadales bacterium]
MSIDLPAHGLKIQASIKSGTSSAAWHPVTIIGYHAVLVAMDHDGLDDARLLEAAKLMVGTRNACCKAGVLSENIVRA